MTTVRQFTCSDLFRFNSINLGPLTRTFSLNLYLQHLCIWPDYFLTAESPAGDLVGYIMGKSEGASENNWHGHVTTVAAAPEFRRLGVAAKLMNALENISEKKECLFVDLFVRVSNTAAINMFRLLGYTVYRVILQNHSEDIDEDVYDMRKALSRDPEKKSFLPFCMHVGGQDVEV